MSLLVNQNSFSQVSKQEAIDFVTDSIVGNNIDSVNIYMESNPIFDTYYQLGVSDSIYSPYNQYWLFFCRYCALYFSMGSQLLLCFN